MNLGSSDFVEIFEDFEAAEVLELPTDVHGHRMGSSWDKSWTESGRTGPGNRELCQFFFLRMLLFILEQTPIK